MKTKTGAKTAVGGVKVQMNRRPDAHFFGLVVLVIIWGLIGQFVISNKSAAQVEEFGRFRIYIAAISSLWLLFAYTAAGLNRRGVSVRSVIDPLPLNARRLGMYALIAVGMFFAWGLFSGVLGLFLRPDKAQIQNLLAFFPRGSWEKVLWAVMAFSAAFCEEFIYRGYLQISIQRYCGRIGVAIVLQALAYGFAHAALPWRIMVTVTFLGIFFGAVAGWRRSLVPGMLMHAAFDLLAVLARK